MAIFSWTITFINQFLGALRHTKKFRGIEMYGKYNVSLTYQVIHGNPDL